MRRFVRHRCVSSILILSVLLPGVSQARQVKGVVQDKISGQPIPSVKVWILQTGDSTFTNSSGVYLFPSIPDGSYTFLVGRSTYVPLIKTSVSVSAGCCIGTTGDMDQSGSVDISDLSMMVDYLFHSGPQGTCFAASDVDKSGSIDISDLQLLIDYLFHSQPLPACP
jgi:hypothetical protein